MIDIEIDGKALQVEPGGTIMDAANQAGTYIPHFCYHKKLSIAANCRMCLVQVEKAPKPVPACATPVTNGMKVFTHSAQAVSAQQGVMEFLLINHPLDCPICDQGGECQLQDLAVGYGDSASHYQEEKRVVPDKDLGPLVTTARPFFSAETMVSIGLPAAKKPGPTSTSVRGKPAQGNERLCESELPVATCTSPRSSMRAHSSVTATTSSSSPSW